MRIKTLEGAIKRNNYFELFRLFNEMKVGEEFKATCRACSDGEPYGEPMADIIEKVGDHEWVQKCEGYPDYRIQTTHHMALWFDPDSADIQNIIIETA